MLALSQLGYEVDLLTLPFGDDRDVPGVRILRVSNVCGLKDIPIGPSIWKLPFDAKLYLRARRLIKDRCYDVIHAVEDAGFIAVPLARRSGAKLLFEKHSDPGSYRKRGLRNVVMWAYSRVEAFTIRQADAVIGTGPGLVEQARRVAPDKPVHHIFDIPSSLVEPDAARVRALRAELLQQSDEVLMAYVGSFAVYQGIELLFAAIPEVIRRAPRARFMIIGGTPMEIQERIEWLNKNGAGHAVKFLGKIPPDELPNYLAAADVLISSRIAGANTPLKLLDYLKVGRCILATDNAANRQILNDESAFFVKPDVDSFAAGLAELAGDEARRERLAAKGKTLVRDIYNFAEFKRRLKIVYDELAADPACP